MDRIEIRPPKGTRDFVGEDALNFQKLIDIVKMTYEKYGFEPLFTPAFENFELFLVKGGLGEAVKNEIYYFKDKSERELGLRFDLTMPLVRVVSNYQSIPKPYKRYAIAPVWRYDNPQAYRYREFWQADVDIIGANSILADAECLACVSEALEKIGIRDFFIRVNNRRALEALVRSYVEKERIVQLFRILDKIDKIGEDGVRMELKKNGFREEILDLLKIEGGYETVLKQLKEKNVDGWKELEDLYEFCEMYGISSKLKLDLFLVRGLEYYTSLVFEIDLGKNVSFGGGGRYDNLVGSLSKESLPATGISLGLTRIFEYMKENSLFRREGKKIFVAYFFEFQKNAIELCRKLRKLGIITDINLVDRKLDRQLEYADKKGFDYVIIVGKDEVSKNKVRIKNMRNGEEILIEEDKLEVFVKNSFSI